jgi:hypothetical protein
MSQRNREDQLLAEALKEAMDQDLKALSKTYGSVENHRFSQKFTEKMTEIIQNSEKMGEKRRKLRLFPYAGLVAALVCVLGLAALAPTLRMGSSDSSSSSDGPESGSVAEIADDSGTDTAQSDSDVSDTEASETEGESMALDWQEELLAESAKADQLVSWYYDREEEDEELIMLRSEMRCKMTLRISDVYEVYYETTPGVWERVYHGNRVMRDYREGLVWTDGYAPSEYNMTRSGHYRMVRQVGLYRQVVGLNLTVK